MDNLLAYVSGAVVVALTTYALAWYTHPLRNIPTLGGTDAPLFSYFTAREFSHNSRALIQEGYERFRGRVFKIALYDRWLVIVNGREMADELRRRPDDEVSFADGSEEMVQMKYTIGIEPEVEYHAEVVREKLTRSLAAIFPDIIDEMGLAFEQHIPAKSDEWLPVNVMTAMQEIVARASNRVFVGLPVCRNEHFLKLGIKFAIDVIKDKDYLRHYPKFLKGIVARYTSDSVKTVWSAADHLKPLVEERRRKAEEYGGEWPGKPNDMLQWHLEHPALDNTSLYMIAKRILLMNLGAIHTSSNSMTHVLYDLASSPEYIQPLREEVQTLIAEEGWSKATMGKLWKMDSFLKESLRYNGIALTSMMRKTVKDVTMMDGTFIPKGTMVVTASDPAHFDENNYANASTFDPFRFSRMREGEGQATKHQFVNTAVDFLVFGHGKHACPGRFFAANELKAMLAYILLNYDIKMGGDGKRPPNIYHSGGVVPALNARVLFKKRKSPV